MFKKLIIFLFFIGNLYSYDLYIGGGIASEIDTELNPNYATVKYPSVYLIDAEISRNKKYFDIGLGISYEGNCTYTNYYGVKDGRNYDVISTYGLIRGKLPIKRITPFVALKYGLYPLAINKDDTQLAGIVFGRAALGVFYKKLQFEGSYGGAILGDNDVPEDPLLPITGEWNYALTIKKNIK